MNYRHAERMALKNYQQLNAAPLFKFHDSYFLFKTIIIAPVHAGDQVKKTIYEEYMTNATNYEIILADLKLLDQDLDVYVAGLLSGKLNFFALEMFLAEAKVTASM